MKLYDLVLLMFLIITVVCPLFGWLLESIIRKFMGLPARKGLLGFYIREVIYNLIVPPILPAFNASALVTLGLWAGLELLPYSVTKEVAYALNFLNAQLPPTTQPYFVSLMVIFSGFLILAYIVGVFLNLIGKLFGEIVSYRTIDPRKVEE